MYLAALVSSLQTISIRTWAKTVIVFLVYGLLGKINLKPRIQYCDQRSGQGKRRRHWRLRSVAPAFTNKLHLQRSLGETET